MDSDIYGAIDVSNFQFKARTATFDWKLLHGVDADHVVRVNDTSALEAIMPALQQGSIDAEPFLSTHNYIQLFRLLQLAVEHLWQMRQSHAKVYPAYRQAITAAEAWAEAANNYIHQAGQMLSELQSQQGALLTEELLSSVAAAREALDKADGECNAALDRLEADDLAKRHCSLRRQRLEISWRLVFGVDMQRLIATGDMAQLEQLLPQIAYGNILVEDPASLTARHFRQLIQLGQSALDYLLNGSRHFKASENGGGQPLSGWKEEHKRKKKQQEMLGKAITEHGFTKALRHAAGRMTPSAGGSTTMSPTRPTAGEKTSSISGSGRSSPSANGARAVAESGTSFTQCAAARAAVDFLVASGGAGGSPADASGLSPLRANILRNAGSTEL
eukprot:gene9000-9173_t